MKKSFLLFSILFSINLFADENRSCTKQDATRSLAQVENFKIQNENITTFLSERLSCVVKASVNIEYVRGYATANLDSPLKAYAIDRLESALSKKGYTLNENAKNNIAVHVRLRDDKINYCRIVVLQNLYNGAYRPSEKITEKSYSISDFDCDFDSVFNNIKKCESSI